MADAPQTNLLVLGNSMIEALATNQAVLANFGQCFTAFARGKPDCSKCGGAARRGEDAYNAVRACIGGLPAPKKLLLKRLLNANKIRLRVVGPGSTRRVELTF